jgi:acetyl-CoA carboxylase/biotin carboxylase 1
LFVLGLVDELKPKFNVAWKDDTNPALGFEYLYLTEEDYKSLLPGTFMSIVVVVVASSVGGVVS